MKSKTLAAALFAGTAFAGFAPAFAGQAPYGTSAPNFPVSSHDHVSNAPLVRTSAFSLNTPLDHIAANKRGKAVLERDLPGLMASRSYPLFDDMSLSQIATMSGGRLNQTKLNLVQADLARLSSSAGDRP